MVGVVPLALSMYQYGKTIKRLGGKGVYVNPNMVEAAAILLLGFVLLFISIMNIEVL